MIIVENWENQQTNKSIVHCKDCMKQLALEEAGLDNIGIVALTIIEGIASQHENRHPEHEITIRHYRRLNEPQILIDMRERLKEARRG